MTALGAQMSAAPCRCLSALSGPTGSAYTRLLRFKPAKLRRKPAKQRHCYRNATVGELKSSCETQVNQSPTFRSLLITPKIVTALHAVSFHCWKDCDLLAELQGFWDEAFYVGLERRGLSEGIFEKLNLQEQAEVLSLAFVDAVVAAVMHRGDTLSPKACTPHSVEDMLSLATAIAALQQVPLKHMVARTPNIQ